MSGPPPCQGRADLMQSSDPDEQAVARYVCMGCPTLYACRAWALTHDVDGVAGGLLPAERDQWRAYGNTTVEPADTYLPLALLFKEQRGLKKTAETVRRVESRLQHTQAGDLAVELGTTVRAVERFKTARRRGHLTTTTT